MKTNFEIYDLHFASKIFEEEHSCTVFKRGKESFSAKGIYSHEICLEWIIEDLLKTIKQLKKRGKK